MARRSGHGGILVRTTCGQAIQVAGRVKKGGDRINNSVCQTKEPGYLLFGAETEKEMSLDAARDA